MAFFTRSEARHTPSTIHLPKKEFILVTSGIDQASIFLLPEIMLSVFAHTTAPQAVRMRQVCKLWRSWLDSDSWVNENLWQQLCRRDFKKATLVASETALKQYALLYQLQKGQALKQHTLDQHKAEINKMDFSADCKTLITACYDKKIRLWDLKTGHLIKTLQGHQKAVTSAVFIQSNQYILATDWDFTARLWRVEDAQTVGVFKQHIDSIHAVDITKDGHLIATASADKTARLWSAQTGACLHILNQHKESIFFAAFDSNDKRLMSVSTDDQTCIWDVKSGKLLQQLKGYQAAIHSVISPRHLLKVSQKQIDAVWQLLDGGIVHELKQHLPNFDLKWSTFSTDLQYVALRKDYADKQITLRKIADSNLCHQLVSEQLAVEMIFSPDSTTLLTIHQKQGLSATLQLWETATGKRLHSLATLGERITQAVFSPHGQFVVTVDHSYHSAWLWNVATGEPMTNLVTQSGPIMSCAFTPDSSALITLSFGNRVQILQFAPDPRRLAEV